MSAPKLLYLVTEDSYFCSHRLPLAQAARQAGFAVSVATRVNRHGAEIRDAGIELYPIGLSRGGTNPLHDLRSLGEITTLYRKVRPDLVHHVALKPVIYGSIAARRAGVRNVVNALAGLGYVFSSPDLKARLLRPMIETALRWLLDRRHSWLIVQNPSDLDLLASRGVVGRARTTLIRGSGVDLSIFKPSPEPAGIPLVVLPARMLRDKGVEEFVAAARALRARGVVARFALVGDTDPENPGCIDDEKIAAWAREGAVEYWGWREDMAAVFRECSLVCLPSWREGLPKALIEAAASARAIVTCDVPGCRDVVRHGDNGLLVPPRESKALADALARLIADSDERRRMGERGGERAREFSIDQVVAATLALYREVLSAQSYYPRP